MRVAVVGAGRMGARHAVNLAAIAGVEVAMVADPDVDAAEAAARAAGGAAVSADPLEALGLANIDAAVIASPDAAHPEHAGAAIERGLPVLCEKPLAVTAEGAHAVVDAEVALGQRLVQVGFMRVFDPAHRELHDAIAAGQIGKPLRMVGVHRNVTEDPRSAIDLIVQSGIHEMHSARWLLDGEIVGVATQTVDAPAEGAALLTLIHLTLDNGTLASIEVHDESYGYDVSVEVLGTEGAVATGPHSLITRAAAGDRSSAVSGHWLDRFARAYELELASWIDGVRAGTPVTGPDAWDGYVANVVAEAAVESVRTGVPVEIEPLARPALYDPNRESP